MPSSAPATDSGFQQLWDRCLGFLDWSLERALVEQERALLRECSAVQPGTVRNQLLGGEAIRALDQFRHVAPLTVYEDYANTLGERSTVALSDPPDTWLLTSGRASGKPKWVPLSLQAREELGWTTLGIIMAALAPSPREISLPERLRILNMTAPPPYFTGTAVTSLATGGVWPTRLYPDSNAVADGATFDERMALAFQEAAVGGVDVVLSYSSVLAGVAASLAGEQGEALLQAAIRSRGPRAFVQRLLRAPRKTALPRQIWAPSVVIGGGTDSELFRDDIRDQWGCDPLDVLASTEALFIGMQTWDRSALTLIPQFNYFEFIPETELTREAVGSTSQSVGVRPRS